MSIKSEIMEAVNELIESLVYNSDNDFFNDVVERVINSERFDFDEIAEAEDEE